MTETMRAVVLDAPGEADVLQIREIPLPQVSAGEVLIRVRAFGLNRSELHLRQGVAGNASFPRVPGIEAVGEVSLAPGGEFSAGQFVATMMGGMGREFDGGYAEFVAVPAAQVIPFTSELDWSTLGAVPEMLQTAYGSLHIGLEARAGQTILIRGGTSSVGLAASVLAKRAGITVITTTRNPHRRELLQRFGATHVLIDDGRVAQQVRELVPGGADGAIELVGTDALPDTLRSVRRGGTVCFTGMLSDNWTIPDFYPMDYIPNGVRLTAYHGEAVELPAHEFQHFIDDLESGLATVPIGHVYPFEEIVQAHRDLETSAHPGKLVVVI